MKLVLIDRDGVINVELPGYVTRPEELQILPQALEAFALFHRHGFTCVVITNQSVVGRGIISEAELQAIHDFMGMEIQNHGGCVAEVISCTDMPAHATARRKPGCGMLQEALAKYQAKPENTAFIGDALTDMQAALSAGCQRYLVMTGKGKASLESLPASLQPVVVCQDIGEAAEKLCGYVPAHPIFAAS